MLERRFEAYHFGVRLGAHETGKPVEAIAADAAASLRRLAVLFLEEDPERQRKRMETVRAHLFGELRDLRLVAHQRMSIGRARGRLGGVDAMLTVHVVELLGLRVVRLEVLIAQRPGRRDATGVLDLAEVLPSQAEQRRAVELRVASDVLVCTESE